MNMPKLEEKYQEYLLEIPELLSVVQLLAAREAFFQGASAVYELLKKKAEDPSVTDHEGGKFFASIKEEIDQNLKGKGYES